VRLSTFLVSVVLMTGLPFAVLTSAFADPSPSPGPSADAGPEIQNSGRPINVSSCGGSGKSFAAEETILSGWAIPVDYENISPKTATRVVFEVVDDQNAVAELIDNGTFAPQTEIKHLVPTTGPVHLSPHELTKLSCRAIQVTYSDGTTWSDGVQLITNIINQPDSPVRITKCFYAYTNPQAGNYDMDVAVSFVDVAERPAVAVRFGFTTFTAFDETLASEYGTITGEFSTNALIEPGYNPSSWTAAGPQPGNAAWRFPSSTNAVRLSCFVDAAKFTDGSKWMRAKS
jgi:hypothetical protein